MAASKVAIWNLALGHLKARARVESETEDSNERKYCDLYYDHARRTLIERYDLSFARKTVSLADITDDFSDDELRGWGYAYARPSDCVQVRHLHPVVSRYPFDQTLTPAGTGRAILTNVSPAILVYSADIEEVSLFPASFDNALSWVLAGHIGPVLGVDPQMADRAFQMGEAMAARAANADFNAREPLEDIPEAPWIEAR